MTRDEGERRYRTFYEVVEVEERMVNHKRDLFFICLLLIGITLACYHPAGTFGFVGYDDGLYLKENPHVRAGLTAEGVLWAFRSFDAGNWHPVTWLSLMTDVSLFGVNPRASHWVNIGIHIANTLLLFLLLVQATGAKWRSAIVAALFAVHPLHVESVAWISERKDVLSTFWGLLSLSAYVSYARTRRRQPYLLCALFLMIGLMAKSMLVTFPLLMLLLDVWPLNRFQLGAKGSIRSVWPLLREKIPLFLIIVAVSVVTVPAQGAFLSLKSVSDYPIFVRIANAAVSYLVYLGRTVWPFNLSVYYPHPGTDIAWWFALLAGTALVFVSAAVVVLRRFPYLFLGWFWYVGTLVPVIGIVQIGTQAMADRYTYIPLIGIFWAVVWGFGDLASRRRFLQIGAALGAAAVLCFFCIRTYTQVFVWENTETLFGHALKVNEKNAVAHCNFGMTLYRKNELDAALNHFQRALEIDPKYLDAANNLGVVLLEMGDFKEAERIFRRILKAGPDRKRAYLACSNLGLLYARQGKDREAIDAYTRAIEYRPDSPEAYHRVGLVFIRRRNLAAAREAFQFAIEVDPTFAPAIKSLEQLREIEKERLQGR